MYLSYLPFFLTMRCVSVIFLTRAPRKLPAVEELRVNGLDCFRLAIATLLSFVYSLKDHPIVGFLLHLFFRLQDLHNLSNFSRIFCTLGLKWDGKFLHFQNYWVFIGDPICRGNGHFKKMAGDPLGVFPTNLVGYYEYTILTYMSSCCGHNDGCSQQ